MKNLCTTICTIIVLLVKMPVHAQTPRFNSYPAAAATLFLNFDGEYVSGTSWNWYGPIDAQPAGLPAGVVREIFDRVAEDYRPFNINVTTDSAVYAAAPYNRRAHVVITPTSSWYGNAGGVAYVGCFNWGDDTPAWVFSVLLHNNVKNIAEACSHELGHTLGLQHQSIYDGSCTKTAEYNSGQGDGEIGWAPIMGVGYSKNLTTWHTGTSTVGCSTVQNDMEVIAGSSNNIGFRTDDYGNSPATAAEISIQGESFAAKGIINRTQDADLFRINVDHPGQLQVNAVPQNVGAGNQGADLDLRLCLLNTAGDTLGSYNPLTLLDASIDTSLSPGVYYIAVSSTGNINHTGYGCLGAYLFTGSMLTVLPVQQLILYGAASTDRHMLSWRSVSNEATASFTIESSADGKQFQSLAVVPAADQTYSYHPSGASMYYRLKSVIPRSGKTFYSNIIHLFTQSAGPDIRLLGNPADPAVLFTSNSNCTYRLFDANGRLLNKGGAVSGINRIDISRAPRGLLLLEVLDATGGRTGKLIIR